MKMNQKLSHHIYRSSLIGLLSTSVLLTMTVGGATAATVSSAERVAAVTPSDKQLTTKKVVRTISYVDPLTGKEHTVHQVASYQFDRAGQLIRTVNPVWQPFFTPIFPGYVPTNGVEIAPKVTTPDTPDKEEKFTYIPLIDKNDQSYMARIHFSALDGTDLRTYDTGVLGENDNPLLSFTLPTPPDGWEYVDQDQLPKSIAVTPGTTNAFTFLVREKLPTKKVNRKLTKRISSSVARSSCTCQAVTKPSCNTLRRRGTLPSRTARPVMVNGRSPRLLNCRCHRWRVTNSLPPRWRPCS